jgi:ribosomal protein S18 acetylase RimI-like enzyme
MGAVTVVPAMESHAAGIARVHVDAWRGEYRGVIPQAYLDALSYGQREHGWRKWLQDGGLYRVALDGEGSVVGFSAGGTPHVPLPPHDGELYAIYVDPPWQGRGVGSLLFDAMLEELRRAGTPNVHCWVLEANPRARAFYERKGGRVVAQRTEVIGGKPLAELAYGFPA